MYCFSSYSFAASYRVSLLVGILPPSLGSPSCVGCTSQGMVGRVRLEFSIHSGCCLGTPMDFHAWWDWNLPWILPPSTSTITCGGDRPTRFVRNPRRRDASRRGMRAPPLSKGTEICLPVLCGRRYETDQRDGQFCPLPAEEMLFSL